ncbi:DUF1036 domain-containing protein [Maritimibacter sp. DP1N21-5]|uniref:DUF1036 domain-containing protein n=1 Tax=Maritimibacter sp. DP1N21-5 TaxID=2836867 RepID=UPI001C46A69D|nr:DUF1036 domain-containing protein [Maritimibacter sp. DP1N21-5]MBV7409367.1 DUF1036 domain-containing protein [Maritimibacter sp. DP1N21-5]
MKTLYLLAALGLAPTAALAELRFCNDTDEVVSVAVGYKGAQDWTSEGWWNVDPGDCKGVTVGDGPKTHYYYRVEARGITFEHEAYMFCTIDEEFTIVGDTDCDARGYDREEFVEIAMEGADDHTVTFSATEDPAQVGTGPATDRTANAAGSGGDTGSAQTETGGAALLRNVLRTSPEVETAPGGTYGEPFTITGLFSHCDVLDAGINCYFIHDGWIYTASSYNHTSTVLLEDLNTRELNTTMLFTGDLSSYEGKEAEIVLTSYFETASDGFESERAALQGFWKSADDSQFEVVIHGSSYEEVYEGIPDVPAMMQFMQGCPDAPGDGVAFQLVTPDGLDDRCFFVSYVDDNAFELIYAGRGNTLAFVRN